MTVKWDELSPEERDALVAEKVMGQRVFRFPRLEDAPEHAVLIDEHDIITSKIPPYTTDMNAAWKVVIAISKRQAQNQVFMEHLGALLDSWNVRTLSFSVFAGITPERICKAALIAVGAAIE